MKKYSYFILIIIVFFAGCKSFFEQSRENIVRTGEITTFFNGAIVKGLLFDVGDDPKKKIINYGHVWSLEDEPSVEDANDSISPPQGSRDTFGDYESILSDLIPEKTYYLRAFAQNEEGISYGNTITFIPGLVRTNSVFNISKNSATLRGLRSTTVVAESIGFCYSTESNPTIANSVVLASNTISSNVFEVNLQGLSAGTIYFIRPFMKYEGGNKVTYGEDFFFPTYN